MSGADDNGLTACIRLNVWGDATAAALAVREWYAADHFISLITPENVRSGRVAERPGARPTSTGRVTNEDWVVREHPR